MLGLARNVPLPRLAKQPFRLPREGVGTGEKGDVYVFADTFSTHFDVTVPAAAVGVLVQAGYRVLPVLPAAGDPEPKRGLCCGRTYLTHGLVDQARYEGQRTLAALRPAIAAGAPVIGLEPSCLLSLRDELYCLGLGAEVGMLGKNLYLLEEFLVREQARGRLDLVFHPVAAKVLVHGHCHQKAFGAMKSLRKVLAWIPELEYQLIDSSCCGMAGSFGLEAEHAQPSRAMAELALLTAKRSGLSSRPR